MEEKGERKERMITREGGRDGRIEKREDESKEEENKE